jgi:hypothetical protein
MMPHMSRNYESRVTDDGNHVMVPNPNEMISIVTPMTRANVQILKPRGVDEKLDPQCGEVQHQTCFPDSFMLTDTIPNPMGPSTSNGMSRKAPSYS